MAQYSFAGIVAALAAATFAAVAQQCASDLDCSLNGVCDVGSGACACDAPWAGAACERLAFNATTRAVARSVFDTPSNNSWGGPIVADANGRLHIYMPVYPPGSLYTPSAIKHGVADAVEGPWSFDELPDLNVTVGENPAALVYTDAASNASVVSLWVSGLVFLAASPFGPFQAVPRFSYPGGNPAPVFHNGAFFMTNQHTTQVFSTPSLAPDSAWTVVANISHASFPSDTYFVEDPMMLIDRRGRWHIINHAYDNAQYESCAQSDVSAHWFSADGLDWHYSRQPWNHTVEYDDGGSHTYVTLERPWLHIDSRSGAATHLVLAADIVTGDEGCENRTAHSHGGHCPCDNCKWADKAGTTVIALAPAE